MLSSTGAPTRCAWFACCAGSGENTATVSPTDRTAAGTVKPATVLVLGVGVAGLQALATAKRLGGRTTGYDVRPEVATAAAATRRRSVGELAGHLPDLLLVGAEVGGVEAPEADPLVGECPDAL